MAGAGSKSLFDEGCSDVKIRGYWLAFPQHTTYLVGEQRRVDSLSGHRGASGSNGRPRVGARSVARRQSVLVIGERIEGPALRVDEDSCPACFATPPPWLQLTAVWGDYFTTLDW